MGTGSSLKTHSHVLIVARVLIVAATAFAAAALLQAPAHASEVYWQPSASLTAEGDTNLDLEPGNRTRTLGALGMVSSVIGITNPASDVNIRPRLEYREYPEDAQDNRLEAYLDFNAIQRWQRSAFSVFGNLEHRDDFNAEFNPAIYDTFNPAPPTTPETGKANIGGTRDSAYVVPTYNFKFSPLLAGGLSAVYQRIQYSPNDEFTHVDFQYYLGKAALTWTLSERSELSFGGFGSKYEALRFDSHATGEGGSVDFDTHWTQKLSTSASVIFERVNVTQTAPEILDTSANAWGGTVGVVYTAQVSRFKFNAGRVVTPSGGGALYTSDQIRFQYDRDITYRLTATAALIGLRDRGVTSNVAGDPRSYLQSVLEAKWMMARTWFLQGGYQYSWQKFQLDPSGAASNRIYIRVVYQGLGVQR
jgi:hypothetical protein